MRITSDVIRRERDRVRDRADTVVPLINRVRNRLAEEFDAEIDSVDRAAYRDAVTEVFADGDRAVNVAALVALLSDLDVEGDYPGFVVDELLGRELAGTVAGEQPLRLLAESTFHYADTVTRGAPDDGAGLDDLDAALAAGFQTRLPGWEWRERDSPFAVE
ncbi:MAG: hypothetical protein V5A37_07145 [Halobacteriales archaeon]